ncbi:hypothetical protein D1AOALGA4SA_8852 [Olavius algarvensis Delta 1 endosymbiont]|nr:hypothetical protein D1AOALGA4SA_8852 [Olavius algarvensis Delta 1 endosymbiont]
MPDKTEDVPVLEKAAPVWGGAAFFYAEKTGARHSMTIGSHLRV